MAMFDPSRSGVTATTVSLTLFVALSLLPPDTALAREASEPPRTLLERAHAIATTDLDAAIELAKRAAEIAQASATDVPSKIEETTARLYLTQLLRVSLLGVRLEDSKLSLYREQLDRLDALLPTHAPRTELHVLRAELGLILNDTPEAIRHARAALLSAAASPGREVLDHAIEGQGLTVPENTVRLILGIALARENLEAEEALDLLTNALQGSIDFRFRNWLVTGKQRLAVSYTARGDYDNARRLLDDITPPSAESVAVRLYTLLQMVIVASRPGHLDQGERLIGELLALLPRESDPVTRGHLLTGLVVPLLEIGATQRAEQTFAEAADLLAGDTDGLRQLLQELSTLILPVVERLDLPASGARMYERLVSGLPVSTDPRLTLSLYATLGRFYAELGQVEPFVVVWQKTHADHRQAPNWKAVQELYFSAARLFMYWDPTRAAEFSRDAVNVGFGQWTANPGLLFRGLRHAVKIAMEMGRYEDAVDFALIGRGLSHGVERVDERVDDVCEFLVDAGEAMTQLGRFDLAWETFIMALTLTRAAKRDWGPRARLGVSRLSALAGDTEGSINVLRPKGGEPPPAEPKAVVERGPEFLLHLGQLARSLGNLERAERDFRACIEGVTTFVRRPAIEAKCRWQLAELLQEREEWTEAFAQVGRVYEALGAARSPFIDKVTVFLQMALKHLAWGYFEWVEQDVAVGLAELGKMPDTARVLAYRALYEALRLLTQRRPTPSEMDVTSLRSTLTKLFREPYLSVLEVDVLMQVGYALRLLGEDSLALDLFTELAARVEFMRDALISARGEPHLRLRVAFGDKIDPVFQNIVEIHMQQRAHDGVLKALVTHEANRARAGGELRWLRAKEEAPSVGGDALEIARRRLERAVIQHSAGRTRAAIDVLSLKLGLREGTPTSEDTGLKPTAIPQRRSSSPIHIAAVQTRLDASTAILVFHLTERLAGAWVISKDHIQWRELASLRDIERVILEFRTALNSPENVDEARFKTIAKGAYAALVKPFMSDIRATDKLIIIPDGSTFGVPFEALVISDGADAGRYLVERYRVSYQLSLELLRWSASQPTEGKPRRLLLIGNPKEPHGFVGYRKTLLQKLPGAKQEMEAVQRVFGREDTVSYEGEEARNDTLRRDLSSFTTIHIATHGIANERYPWQSHLAFAGEDGQLSLWDLSKLTVPAELVVLSACETGRGQVLAGEGIWGFQSQFLGSGAKNVVVSLWRVEDQSTARLMEEFYRAMAPSFTGYGKALRMAKLRVLNEPQWQHPYFWAPFVLYGGLD